MAPDEREILQETVNEYYQRFIGVMQAKCHITDPETIRIATDGRVFSGEAAKKIGLVDDTGLLSDAIDIAKQKAHCPDAKVVMYRRPYGYGGSIYAQDNLPAPQANTIQLPLPESVSLPQGFYYLWQQ